MRGFLFDSNKLSEEDPDNNNIFPEKVKSCSCTCPGLEKSRTKGGKRGKDVFLLPCQPRGGGGGGGEKILFTSYFTQREGGGGGEGGGGEDKILCTSYVSQSEVGE